MYHRSLILDLLTPPAVRCLYSLFCTSRPKVVVIFPKAVDLEKLSYTCASLVTIGANHVELLFASHTSSPPTQFRASAKFITKDFLLPPKIKLRWYIYISVPQKNLDRGTHRSQDPSEP